MTASRHWLNYIDVLAVFVGLVNWVFDGAGGLNMTIVRLFRLVKVLKSLRIVKIAKVLESLHLLMHAMQASISTLFWSLIVLTVIQCIVGMILCQLVQDYLIDDDKPVADRMKVYRYYGNFVYTMITMFEIHLANWGPACRVLVDHVGVGYGIFFIMYRCMAGFAVLNVINAVFIQHTMKVASSRDEVIVMQKKKAQDQYNRQLRALFKRIDRSGDGKVTEPEVAHMMHDTHMKNWMAALDIDAQDMKNVFDMLDDGGGEVTLEEYLEGAARLKGPAKNIDMARVLSQLAHIEKLVSSTCRRAPSRQPTVESASAVLNRHQISGEVEHTSV